MIEMARLKGSKATDNKIRWEADVDGTAFKLYIPKWRVPEPWPQVIDVTISPHAQRPLAKLPPDAARKSPGSRAVPIEAHLERFREHTQTVRYKPAGDPSEWEIGEPYIPAEMTFDSAKLLTITVKWQRSSG